jgi:peptidoglycan/LPS O-acetylase OafA/YrhL
MWGDFEFMSFAQERFSPIDYKTRFPALDGIRALAVLLVFALHYGGGSHGGLLLRVLNEVRSRGALGVDLFFVLSGFLITGILFDTRNDSHYFKRFFARRSVRIFPIVYLLFAILAVLTPVLGYVWYWKQALFLVYLGNLAANADFGLYLLRSVKHPAAEASLSHLWSLCVEEQFYIVWPLVVWLVRDRVKLIWTSAVLCLVALGLRLVMLASVSTATAALWIPRSLPFRLDSLLFGAILALILRGPAAHPLQRSMKWIFLSAFAVFFVGERLSPAFDSVWELAWMPTVIGVAAMGLIGGTLRQGSTFYRVFSLRPLKVIGKYSYGFYVYHLVWSKAWLGVLVYFETRLQSLAMAGLVTLPLVFGSTFLVAKLSYDLFEVRFLKLKRHFEYDSEVLEHRTAFAADGN